ncbi:hypothetical protein KPH14_004501 [Odynerus spinipes]|uniref:Uncharacterized protein n=1 Tax=Odynerus spinipes TaxID=1348599 RepID=A0AAD9VPC3_9HYME|nr:hypothetical protein KPH14_004501 [Odynerus spinipes]
MSTTAASSLLHCELAVRITSCGNSRKTVTGPHHGPLRFDTGKTRRNTQCFQKNIIDPNKIIRLANS